MEKILREFCGGNPIVPDGEEGRYSRIRIKTLRLRKKEKPGTRKTMGGISRIVKKVVEMIFNEGSPSQDN